LAAAVFSQTATGDARLREAIALAPQSLTQDPPFSRLDLPCRNLLIYLELEIEPGDKKGFGMRLIERACTYELKGKGNWNTPPAV
jgi:hypothetical protein